MNRFLRIQPHSICLIVVVILVGLPVTGQADEPRTDDKSVEKTGDSVDPFINADKAQEALTGIWEYSADIKKSSPTYPAVISKDGEIGWPLDGNKPVFVDKTTSSQIRLDLRRQENFRLEMVVTDQSGKYVGYMFGEGRWSLRGRLLVLTFILDDEIERWAFFIESLSSDQICVKGIESTVELIGNGRGVFAKKQAFTPLAVPDGYNIEIDESSFGSAQADVAQYLRDNLNADVEINE